MRLFVLLSSLARKKSSGLESAATIRTKVFVWGLNDKDQLGGLKGSKVLHLRKNAFKGENGLHLSFKRGRTGFV